MSTYGALTAAVGMGEPITPEGRARHLKGSLRQVIGDHAKHGLFQSAVLSKPVDLVGRGVITPDRNMDMRREEEGRQCVSVGGTDAVEHLPGGIAVDHRGQARQTSD